MCQHTTLCLTVLLCASLFPTNVTGDRFKKAQNRTFEGFEIDNTPQNFTSEFTFIHGTDPQFGLVAAAASPDPSDLGDEWTTEIASLRQAIVEWNALQPPPAFVVLTGDLVNAFPSRNASLRRRQLDDLRAELTTLRDDIPLVLLGGNHDIDDTPTEDSIRGYTDEFGDDYFTFAAGNVLFLVLNTQLYMNHTLVPELYRAQTEWLDGQLAATANRSFAHRIVLQHIPWFLNTVDDESGWSTIPQSERRPVLTKLYEAGFGHIFAGHLHRNALGHFEDTEMVTSSAIGWQNTDLGPPNVTAGYRVVRVTRDAVTHRYVEIGTVNSRGYASYVPTHYWVFLGIFTVSLMAYPLGFQSCKFKLV